MNNLILGDAHQEITELTDQSVDLIFLDPPYNAGLTTSILRVDGSEVAGTTYDWDNQDKLRYRQDFEVFLKQCWRVLKDSGCIWVCGSYHSIYFFGEKLLELGFFIRNEIIWKKRNPTPNFRGVRFTHSHETLIWATKAEDNNYTFNYNATKEETGRQLHDVWFYPSPKGSDRLKVKGKKHPNQKPLTLLYRIIAYTSNRGDFVFEPFCGTAPASYVAQSLGRDSLGVDFDIDWLTLAQQRLTLKESFSLKSKRNLIAKKLFN